MPNDLSRRGSPILVLAFALALAAVGAPVLLGRQAAPAGPQADVPRIEFEKITLANGLEVILSEDHRLPLVAVDLWYHVGPAYEEPGRTGFAHLFEHMMFRGSKHIPEGHWGVINGAGGTTINGTTGFDRTNYFETVPTNELEVALWLESDRMGYMLDVLDQTSLSNQQDVVRNERRQSRENRPYGIVEEAVYHQLFPKTHPYYAAVIGSHADIQAAKLDDARSFFKRYYAPNNVSLAIVGDINKADTRKLVEKYFGTFKRGADVPKPTVVTPPITSERRAVVPDRVELPRVYMSWLTPPIFKPGNADLDIAGRILGDGKSSRLYKALVYDKQIAQSVSVDQDSLMLGSIFQVEATARPGHSVEEIEKALDEELARFRDRGPEPAEVDKARNAIETQIVEELERLGGFGGVADRLSLYNHHLGDPGFLGRDIERYRQVTSASVADVVRKQLVTNARVVVYGVPGQADLGPTVPSSPPSTAGSAQPNDSVNADEPWRRQQPKPGPEREFNVAVPTSFQLANGLTVIVNERPGLPIVSTSLVIRSGSGANPPAKPGLASFTAAMLTGGTASRSAVDIANQVAQLGATLTAASATDASQIAGTSLRRTFPRLLEILSDLARHPAFPPEEIERQRINRLASLVQRRGDAGSIATGTFAAALYGPDHPYGQIELGTEASNRAMTREDLRTFWSSNFVPNNAALIVSGQVTAADLRPLAEKHFGDWARGTPVRPALGAPATTKARLVLVDKPGAPQTQLRVGLVAAPRSTPDYEALRIMNQALGGMFSSRLNLSIREKHGYTYGIFSQFQYSQAPGPFVVSTGVRTDVTAPAVSETLKELRRIQEAPLSPEELALAKDAVVRALPADFESSGRVNASTATAYIYDLGLDYYRTLPRRLSAVTAADALAAAAKYIVPGRLVVVAVGDRSKIGAPLEQLNIGPMEVRSPDGTPVAGP